MEDHRAQLKQIHVQPTWTCWPGLCLFGSHLVLWRLNFSVALFSASCPWILYFDKNVGGNFCSCFFTKNQSVTNISEKAEHRVSNSGFILVNEPCGFLIKFSEGQPDLEGVKILSQSRPSFIKATMVYCISPCVAWTWSGIKMGILSNRTLLKAVCVWLFCIKT